jgi:acetyl esterase/lipase
MTPSPPATSEFQRVFGTLGALWSMVGPVRDVDAPTHAGLLYAPAEGRRGRAPRADVYLPDGPGPHPSIVWVHGGGFTVGARDMKPMRLLATACRRAGIAAMTFDYRLLFRGGSARTGVEDTGLAHRFWVDSAARFALDPARIALGGLSAGGCLALLAAPTLSPAPHKLVGVFPLYDFASLRGGASGLLARLAGGPDPEARRGVSPLHTALPAMPTLLQHGTADTLIPVADAERYAARRVAEGLPTTLRIYPGAPHAYHNMPDTETARAAVAELLGFLTAP